MLSRIEQQPQPRDAGQSKAGGSPAAGETGRSRSSQGFWRELEVNVEADAPAQAASSDRPYCVPWKLGPVKLIREIGRGGMGVVWLGWHELLCTDVAVKFILTGRRDCCAASLEHERFLAGARAAAGIRHPGLTRILHADVINAIPYLVMEYISGRTIDAVHHRLRGLMLGDAIAILDTVVDIVAHLHEQEIVHGDIKPANVLLDGSGSLFVTDFGLACHADAAPAFVAGTPAYMAPEMFDGTVNPRTDVYALGIMAYELLAGRLPFDGDRDELRMSHASSPLPRSPLQQRGVPEPVIDFIEHATHRNPLFRIRTAKHMSHLLREKLISTADEGAMRNRLVTLSRRYGAASASGANGASSLSETAGLHASGTTTGRSGSAAVIADFASRKRAQRTHRSRVDRRRAAVVARHDRPTLARWLDFLRMRLW